MIPLIKAEFRKLFSIRSTYIMIAIAMLMVGIVAFYFEGYHLHGAELRDPSQLEGDITGALTSLPLILGSLIAILLIAHEYRYNTVLYTLTSSNSRSKVLLAKIVTISIFALIFTAVLGLSSPLLSYLGVHLHGNSLVGQNIHYVSLVWRGLFYGWGSLMAALVIGVIVRSQVGAIVTLFAIPIAEGTLTQLLKSNATAYFPFSSSNEVLVKPQFGTLPYAHAALVFMAYLVVAWIVAWLLFLRRDAN